MKSSNLGWLATGVGVGFVSALAVGVPASTMVPLLFLVACPLMMLVMMRGMHDQGHNAEHGDGQVPH